MSDLWSNPLWLDSWRVALAIVPVALVIGLAGRFIPCRPSTRHTMWLSVLVLLVVAPVLPALDGDDVQRARRATASVRDAARATFAAFGAIAPSNEAPTRVEPADDDTTAPPLLDAVADARPADATLTEDDVESPIAAPSPAPRRSAPAWSAPARSFERPAAEPRRERVTPPARRRSAPKATLSFDRADVAPPPEVTAAAPAADDSPAPSPSGAARPAEAPEPAAAEAAPWRGWAVAVLARLEGLRQDVLRMPALPARVWLGGAALVVLLAGARTAHFARRVARSAIAPPSVERAVREAARALGLRRVPETRMIDARVTPLVWCGRRCVLVLPRDLWAQLDEAGRTAVIHHELAHLRRRDHWVCWLGMIVGCAYWWHPVVWWARRRLREEADLCCDAWVTNLMPTERRAYATALIETKRFTSHRTNAPAVGLGTDTRRTKRFARRLTMVMTNRTTPRLSLAGAALTGVTAALCWLVTPALACPPKSDAKPVKAVVATAKDVKTTDAKPVTVEILKDGGLVTAVDVKGVVDPKTALRYTDVTPAIVASAGTTPTIVSSSGAIYALACPPEEMEKIREQQQRAAEQARRSYEQARRAAEEAQRSASSTFEQFMQEQGGDADVEQRLRQLEERLEQLMERAHEWGGQLEERLERAMPRIVERFGLAEDPHVADAPRAITVMPMMGGMDCACVGGPGECHCEQVSRDYHLSKGKLKALTTLMSRDDVPVLISPGDGVITVHGTPAQHRAFGAFVRMIDPENAKKNAHADPMMQGQYDQALDLYREIQANPRRQRIEGVDEDVRRQLEEHMQHLREAEQLHRQHADQALEHDHAIHEHRARLEQALAQQRARASDHASERAALKQHLKELEAHYRELERRARSMFRDAEQKERASDRLRRKAEQALEKAETREGEAADELRVRADVMLTEADELRILSERLEADGDATELEAERLELEFETIEERIEAIEETLEKLREAAGDLEMQLAEARGR